MAHYLDIQLRQDPEFTAHQLLAALYARLHRALVRLEADSIAVSFPLHNASAHPRLGNCLRMIGPANDLARLMSLEWLTGMLDHVAVGGIAPVPVDAEHRTLRRVQAKSNPERLRRRQMKRHNLTETQALERVPDSAAEKLDLPFVQLTSASTGQTFRLYLRLGQPEPALLTGCFNSYGLSSDATVPWF